MRQELVAHSPEPIKGKFHFPTFDELPRTGRLFDESVEEGMARIIPYHIESLSKNSQVAFRVDMQMYLTWCKRNQVQAIPAEPLVLRQFVIEHSKDRAPTTLQRRLSTINKVHSLLGLRRAGEAAEVASAMKNFQEHTQYEVRQAQPLREGNLMLMGSLIDKDKLRDVRDMAITTLAYSTLLRRSEVARVEVEHIDFDPEGDGVVQIGKIKSKKGDRSVHYAYLNPLATFWVKRWLKMSGIESGQLFRSLTRYSTLRERGMTGETIADAINRLGYLVDEDFHFTGHSTRVGAAQDMVAAGIDTTKAMNAGRWKDHKTFMRYVARLSARENGMAELSKGKARP